jgi:hypothetical protein
MSRSFARTLLLQRIIKVISKGIFLRYYSRTPRESGLSICLSRFSLCTHYQRMHFEMFNKILWITQQETSFPSAQTARTYMAVLKRGLVRKSEDLV